MELQVALPGMTTPPRSYRAEIVESLANFRHDWQATAEGTSLLVVAASVGLLLYDVAERSGLTEQERIVIFGKELAEEIEAYVSRSLEMQLRQ